MAVWSNNEDVDAVGACVGVNGARVNAVVDELRDEKIDIVNWSENPAILIENALSPSKVIAVLADPDNKEALVVVPDLQLSLAIVKKDRMQDLQLSLQVLRLILRVSHRQKKKESSMYSMMMNIMMTNTTMMNTMQNMMTSIMMESITMTNTTTENITMMNMMKKAKKLIQ